MSERLMGWPIRSLCQIAAVISPAARRQAQDGLRGASWAWRELTVS